MYDATRVCLKYCICGILHFADLRNILALSPWKKTRQL